jgi:hypothetical protein
MRARETTCSASGAEVVEIARLLHSVAEVALIERQQLADGLRVRLRASEESERLLREYVRRERQCCPFLDLSLTRHDDELSLEVRGPAEAAPILNLLSLLATSAP